MAGTQTELQHPRVVSPAEWLAARKEHLAKEKEFTRLRDELSRQRLALPWEKVEKAYTFNGPNGTETLSDLFEKRSQLLVYHFMFGPGWKEGCASCSYLADHFDGMTPHLEHRDVTFAVISSAPWPEIEAFQKRMGWRFKWVSSSGSDFNSDYNVSFTKEQVSTGRVNYNFGVIESPMEELPGASAFIKEESGDVFHTYSTYSRGLDILVGAYNFLDMAPKGRDEDGLAFSMAWVRHHDKYTDGYELDTKRLYSLPEISGGKP